MKAAPAPSFWTIFPWEISFSAVLGCRSAFTCRMTASQASFEFSRNGVSIEMEEDPLSCKGLDLAIAHWLAGRDMFRGDWHHYSQGK